MLKALRISDLLTCTGNSISTVALVADTGEATIRGVGTDSISATVRITTCKINNALAGIGQGG